MNLFAQYLESEEFNLHSSNHPESISPFRFWIHIPDKANNEFSILEIFKRAAKNMLDSKSIEIRRYKDGYDINTSTYEDYKTILKYFNNLFHLRKIGITSFVPLSKIGAGPYGFREYTVGDYFLKNSRPYIFFGGKKPKPKKHNPKEALQYLKEMPEHEGTTIKGGFFDGQDMRDVWQELISSLIEIQSGKWDKNRINGETKSIIVARAKSITDYMKMLTNLLSHAPNFEWRKKIHELIETVSTESKMRNKYLVQELQKLGEI